MTPFELRILEADSRFYEGSCDSLIIPVEDGSYGILAGHSNTIMVIVPGELKYRPVGGAYEIAAVSNGIVKIEDNTVLVLADSVEGLDEIDANRSKREAELAREKMRQDVSRAEFLAAERQLGRAMNRLRIRNKFLGEDK